MTLDQLKLTLSNSLPPADFPEPLQALWWAAKGDWDKAHKLVQDDEGSDAAWVHAYLHRVEGDLPNAGYWYRSANRPVARSPLEEEWAALVEEFLGR
jgi:hypothetical protein